MPASQTYFENSNNGIGLYGLKYFVLISNNNTMNPIFSPRSEHASTYVSLHAILGHVNIKKSKFCNEKDF